MKTLEPQDSLVTEFRPGKPESGEARSGLGGNRRLTNIQCLRAFAALAVAGLHTKFHFPQMKSFGAFGVDLFFVISGYIMARICIREPAFFFRRRLIRILPPYWAATVALFLVALWFPSLVQATRPAMLELIKSLLFIPFLKSNGLIQPLLFLGWTLNCEMYFYAILAISLLFFPRRALWVASGVIVTVTILCMEFGNHSVLGQFYGRFVFFDFLFGILAFFICQQVPERISKMVRIPMLILFLASSVLLILIEAVFPRVDVPNVVTFGVTSFLLVISAVLLSQGGWDTKLSWLVLIGDSSYILYLIHPYCEALFDKIFSRHIIWFRIDTLPGFLISIGFTVTISVLIHLRFENPLVSRLHARWGGSRKN